MCMDVCLNEFMGTMPMKVLTEARALDPLGLQFQVAVSTAGGAGTEPGSLRGTSRTLHC